MFKKKICIKQHDEKDCAAACLATIAKYYGLKYPISKIREIAGTDSHGTNAFGVIKAAETLGFSSKGVRAKPENLKEDIPFPAIAHVMLEGGLLHYVVLYKIKKNRAIIADPAKGIISMEVADFFQIWTGILLLMIPNENFQKGDIRTGVFSRFLAPLKREQSTLFYIFLASLLFTLFGIISAFYFQYLIDEILPYKLKDTLHIISIGIIVLYIFKVILGYFRSYLLLLLSQKIDVQLILGYYNHVISLPLNFFGTRKTGEIVSRLNDASKIRDAISGATISIMLDTLMVIVGGTILFFQNRFLFGITIILIPIYALIVFAYHKRFNQLNRKEMEQNAQLTSYVVESIKGIETIKSYNAQNVASWNTEKDLISLIRTVFKYSLSNLNQDALKQVLELVGGIAILWIGSLQVLKGEMTIGQLITYNALLIYFLQPIQNLINLQPIIQTAVVAGERLAEIMDLEPETMGENRNKISKDHYLGDIQFNNVTFRYGTRDTVLKNITLHINKGESIALVGKSGSGKTTLAKLLLKFYQPEYGEILLDGYHLNDIQTINLRERISYVSQQNFFFSGSVIENLRMGNSENEMDEVIEICKQTKVHEFINQLPSRYETLLEEDANNLSGGQKQRLAITRALLKKPDVLIMDEATSNLDTPTEKAITNMIRKKFKNTTSIIIAHRLSTVMACDKIVVFDSGNIVEFGTHYELLKSKGHYFNLWESQFGTEKIEGIQNLVFNN